MPLLAPPEELYCEQRRRELARIITQGMLRLRQRRRQTGKAAAPPTTAPNSPAERLDVSPEIVLSGESQRPSRAKKTSRLSVRST